MAELSHLAKTEGGAKTSEGLGWPWRRGSQPQIWLAPSTFQFGVHHIWLIIVRINKYQGLAWLGRAQISLDPLITSDAMLPIIWTAHPNNRIRSRSFAFCSRVPVHHSSLLFTEWFSPSGSQGSKESTFSRPRLANRSEESGS